MVQAADDYDALLRGRRRQLGGNHPDASQTQGLAGSPAPIFILISLNWLI
jgi:hypothetical protein